MDINVYNQIYNLFIFFIIGIIIGILFDIFRVIRRTFKTPDIITYIEDTVFWILVGLILLFSIFFFNHGEIRSYIFIGLAIGLFTYILTISKYFININVKILGFIKKLIYIPFKTFYRFIRKILTKIKKIIKKIMKKTSKNENNDEIINNYDKIEL